MQSNTEDFISKSNDSTNDRLKEPKDLLLKRKRPKKKLTTLSNNKV